MARPAVQMEKLEGQKLEFELIMQFYPPKLDIAGYFDVSESTLERFVKKNYKMSYEDLRDKRFGKTRMAIRQKQIEKALDGDKTMLVWLGKQYLGQSDKMETKTELNASNVKDIFINYGDEPNAAEPPHEDTNATAKAH